MESKWKGGVEKRREKWDVEEDTLFSKVERRLVGS